MGIRRKIAIGPGQFADGETVEVQQASEHWNQYLLADGSVVRLKVVVTEIWRVEGQYDNDGNPKYIVRSGNVLAVSSPDEIRKPQ